MKVKVDGIEVEAPFIHHGYVEKDARKVIEKYVEDKDWYLTERFDGKRLKHLQDLLDRAPVARISNPILGFQVLVPKGYRYNAQATEEPNGLLVTFQSEQEGRRTIRLADIDLGNGRADDVHPARTDFAERLALPDT